MGDREFTLDDCWSLELNTRVAWKKVQEGTMDAQMWKGEEDESEMGSEWGEEDDDDDDDEYDDSEDGEEGEEEVTLQQCARISMFPRFGREACFGWLRVMFFVLVEIVRSFGLRCLLWRPTRAKNDRTLLKEP